MTEAEWLTSTDPQRMLAEMPTPFSYFNDRKLRLFACACWDQLSPDDIHLYGKEGAGIEDPMACAEEWCRNPQSPQQRADLIRHIVGNPWRHMGDWSPEINFARSSGFQRLSPKWMRGWLTPTISNLAQALYDGDQGAAGPLHDALLEAGQGERKCETCKGDGKCSSCKGSGKETVWPRDAHGDSHTQLCSHCNDHADRSVIHGHPGPLCGRCLNCGGTGRVPGLAEHFAERRKCEYCGGSGQFRPRPMPSGVLQRTWKSGPCRGKCHGTGWIGYESHPKGCHVLDMFLGKE